MKALAVFHDHGAHCLSWMLRKGFRHVFVAVDAEGYWVRVDGMDGRAAVQVVAGTDYDLAGFYRSKGYAVIETEQGPGIRGPLAIANCVGLAKAILGIRAPLCFTPWQLYNRLRTS